MTSIAKLREAAEKCHADCSDYSCVRRGECGGCAGGKLRDALYKQEQARKQNEQDMALAAQIRRLRKAGLV